jgi:hypothetical protein
VTAIRLTQRRLPQLPSRAPRLRRRWRALAFLASTGLAIAGIAGAGSADAGNVPAPPTYTFSSDATAIGVQVALQRNPDFSSLPDPADIETPDSEAHLDGFGTSTADGHLANLNGLGGVPGLICLVAGAATCAEIPIGTVTAGLIPTFPPPDPLDASASYPVKQTAQAPLLGTKVAQASFASKGFSLSAGAAAATAHQFDTSTSAEAQNVGVAGLLSIGNATTTTTQTATADALTTTAVAKLSDIGVGGTLLHIGTMISTTTVVSRPGKPATDTTSTELGDVKAAGVAATIDGSGVHIDKSGLPTNVVAAVQKLVNQVLGKAGVKLSLATVTRKNDVEGHTVAASGLLLTLDRNVSGVQPITVGLPQGVPCPPIIPSSFPVNPCSGVSFSLDGAYHGQIALGQVGVVSLAEPGGDISSVPPSVGATPPVGTTGPVSGVGPVTIPPTGPSVVSTEPPGPAPDVAQTQRQMADQLNGVSHRLEWFFPLFAVCLLALLGRFRTPARLPSA